MTNICTHAMAEVGKEHRADEYTTKPLSQTWQEAVKLGYMKGAQDVGLIKVKFSASIPATAGRKLMSCAGTQPVLNCSAFSTAVPMGSLPHVPHVNYIIKWMARM